MTCKQPPKNEQRINTVYSAYGMETTPIEELKARGYTNKILTTLRRVRGYKIKVFKVKR